MTYEEDDYDEEYTCFEGPCTCLHAEDAHGWGECGVEDCQCEAGWVE